MRIRLSSLKIKLLLWIMPLFILGMTSMSLAAFSYINSVIREELSGSRLKVINRSAELIDRWLKTLMLEPETIASTPAAKKINDSFEDFDIQNINRYIVLHEKYPDLFQDIYGSDRDGIYHTVLVDEAGISIFEGDINNRPYFISIMNGGPTQITPPLISRTTGILTVFIVAPILDENNQPAGLVGTGLSLKYMHQFVKELKSGESSYSFIFTHDGTIVAHSELDSVIEQSVNMTDLYTDTELISRLASKDNGMFRYKDGKEDLVFFVNGITVTGWQLVSVISTSELFSPAHKMIMTLILIALITMLITAGTVYLIMGKLIRPLQTFVKKTEEIAAGSLDSGEFPIITHDEIGTLGMSFNVMMKNLKDSVSQLKMSEDKYRGIFENSMEGILQTTMDGKIMTANPAMVKMLRFESEEMLINTYTDIQNQLYYNPEDRFKILKQLQEYGMIMNEELQCRCFDGATLWVSLSAYLVHDDEGNPLRIESLVSDISVRKKIEEEKQKLFEELAQSQKLEAVGQLAGGVAHDFNNMLAVILGRSELSLIETDVKDPNYQSFKDIIDAAEHSANLTKQLLAFARKQSVSPEVLNINNEVKSKIKLLRRLISEDIELSFIPDNDVWNIFMDSDQIGQILTNLCVNARDSIEGNGRITIKTKNVEVNSKTSELIEGINPGEYICLSIEDTGSGMDKETQNHIFEPFFTTKDLGRGTGLGLSTIYGIVKQNNGLINVYSEIGKGSIFNIYLPKYSGPEEIGQSQTREVLISEVNASVLLVEDDSRLLGLTKIILESLGCHVFSAESINAALATVQDKHIGIDLLLTDVIMPEMNGYDLYTKINSIRPGIKCLFMSGYSGDILTPKGKPEKEINFIQKPFSIKELSEKILAILKE